MKCDISKCKGACCYNVPIDKTYLSAYRKKIARDVIRLEQYSDDTVLPITNNDQSKNACPFLNEKFRCNIYNVRPKVCRLYGDGDYLLNCEFLTGIKLDAEMVMNSLLHLAATNKSLFKRLVF